MLAKSVIHAGLSVRSQQLASFLMIGSLHKLDESMTDPRKQHNDQDGRNTARLTLRSVRGLPVAYSGPPGAFSWYPWSVLVSRAAMADEEEKSVRVTVKVGPHVFDIPCGKGEQNMKWLACVVAQRFRLMSKSNGRSRQRERKKTPQGCFVPSSVNTVRCSYAGRVQRCTTHHRATPIPQVDGHTVYPSVKVKDAVAEGAAKVKVVLKSVEMCEEDGSAEQTTWAALAFNFSDNGRKR